MESRTARSAWAILLCLALLLQGLVPVSAVYGAEPPPSQAEELPAWSRAEIEVMKSEGIIEGYPDGLFRPVQQVTKEELLILIQRIAGVADEDAELWKSSLAGSAPFGAFRGTEPVTRQEAAYYINRLVQWKAPEEKIYKDSRSLPDWAVPVISAASSLGFVQGFEDGTFRGGEKLTRAQAAVILFRMWRWLTERKLHVAGLRVEDPSGRPLEGAQVYLHEKGRQAVSYWGKTEAQGLFWTLAPNGKYEGTARKDRLVAEGPVEVKRKERFSRLTANPAAVIEGKLVTKDGNPAAGGVLAMTEKPTFFSVADPDGSFRAFVLPNRSYAWTLIDDPGLRARVEAAGGSDGVTGTGAVPTSLQLIGAPKPQRQNCGGCTFNEPAGTFKSPDAGQHVQVGTVSLADARVPGSGEQPPPSGEDPPPPDRTPPGVPGGVTATVGDGAVVVGWSAVQAGDLAGYKVYRSEDGGVTWNAGADAGQTTSYTEDGLSNGTAYTFAVSAYDTSRNESTRSASVTATPQRNEAPAVPTHFTGYVDGTTAHLTWEPNREADLAGYRLYASTDGSEWSLEAELTEPFYSREITGSVWFAVSAYDTAEHESARTLAIKLSLPDSPPPAVPAGVTAVGGDGTIEVTWTANTEADLAGYSIYLDHEPAEYTRVGRVTGYTLTGRTNGRTYSIAVSAFNTEGVSSGLSDWVAVTPQSAQPAVPSGLAGAAGDGTAVLSWTANTDRTAGYKVYRSLDNGSSWDDGTDVGSVTSHRVTGLTNGNAYRFAVAAYTADRVESDRSASVEVIPQPQQQTAPAVPAGVSGTAGDTFVKLAWSPNREADLAGYKLYVSADQGVTWEGKDAGNMTQASRKGLRNGSTYLVAVTAYDEEGYESARSAPLALTPAEPGSPLPDPGDTAPPVPAAALPTFGSMVEFLYTGPRPLQTGVDDGAIKPHLVSVIRGRAADPSGQPLSGVLVTVKHHEELGVTRTRADGMFDMAVNGEGTLLVELAKDGYMPVQRKISVVPGEYAALPDVVLKAYDAKVTVVNLSGTAGLQAAQGSAVTDRDGTRQPTVLIPQGTEAVMIGADGISRPLAEMRFRATEYTVGENGRLAMPAELPEFVGYTHAVELSADEAVAAGAVEVRFNQRLYYYVENYLDFPVGETVPMGYYDRQKGQWVPSDNGKVIRIVASAGGMTSIDADGDGAADTETALAALGFTPQEREKLAELYPAGTGLWRVPIEHFTPWDCNWPYGPPPDAEAPVDKAPKEKQEEEEDPCEEQGSVIGCQNRSLGQRIPIEGTGLALNYTSTRSKGYKAKSKLTVPVSGGSLPDSVKSMSVTVEIAGNTYKKTFTPAPDVTHTFEWDGMDSYKRKLVGLHPYTVTVSYHYNTQYYASPSAFAQSFGRLATAATVIGDRAAGSIAVSRVWKGLLESPENPYREMGIAGWSLDGHHTAVFDGGLLYEGDGTKRALGFAGLDPFATFRNPQGTDTLHTHTLATGPGHSLLAAGFTKEQNGNIVYKVWLIQEDGSIGEIGRFDYEVYSLSADLKGNIYAFFREGRRIYRKDANSGAWTHLAGTGEAATSPPKDGAAAAAIDLPLVSSMAASADGSLYFTAKVNFNDNYLLYRIHPGGRIEAMSQNTYGADSGRAEPAGIGAVAHVSAGADGSLYLMDYTPQFSSSVSRFRKISPDGVISKIAGYTRFSGTGHGAGDGAAALNAYFNAWNISVSRQGDIAFKDQNTGKPYVIRSGVMHELYRQHDVLKAGGPVIHIGMDHAGVLYSYRYNQGYQFFRSQASLETVVSSSDGLSVYEFDSVTGRHLRTLDAMTGNVLRTFGYDAEGRLVRTANRFGNEVAIERGAEGKPTAIVAPNGQRTTLELNGQGELESVIGPAGGAYRMAYANGLLQEFVYPDGGTSRYEYDREGHLAQATEPAGGVKTLERNDLPDGYEILFTDAHGRVTTYRTVISEGKRTYTTIEPGGAQTVTEVRRDRTEKAILPDGTVITKKLGFDPRWGDHTPFVQELVYTTPDGKVLRAGEERTAHLSPLGQLQTYTVKHTVNGDVSTVSYDHAENKYTETTAEGVVTETRLNSLGMVAQVAWPGTGMAPVEYVYDAKGRLERVTQGEKFIAYTHNALGQIISAADASGTVKSYGYDPEGRVTSITTPGNKVYGSQYDALGNLTELTMPDGTKYAQHYNAAGVFDGFGPGGGGLWYDLEHRNGSWLEQSLMSSGRILDYVFEPDGAKRINGLTDPDVERSFAYDGNLNRVRSMTGMVRSDPSRTQTIGYGYSGENVTAMSLTGKVEAGFAYGYDNKLNLTGIGMTVNGAVYNTAFAYNKDDQLTRYGPFQFRREAQLQLVESVHDGVFDIGFTYDKYGQTDTVTYKLGGQTVYAIDYEYDLRGFVAGQTIDTAAGRETVQYGYDPDGQLLEVARTGPGHEVFREAYSYDTNKNRLTAMMSGSAEKTSAYGVYDVLERVGETAYEFDADGFLTRRGEDTFRYGIRGELLEATVTGATYKYTYDAIGRRVAKEDESGRTTRYLYGMPDSIYTLTASVGPDGSVTHYYYTDTGMLIALERDGRRYYVAADAVGTPQLVLDGSGGVVKRLRYSSYGELLADSNPAFELPIGYAGGLEDRETGLIRFGARDYDAGSGRWTARDPILFESGQANLYAYVNNNPVMFNDPCGQFCIGGSLYGGVGAGGKVCIDSEGFSSCVEAGVGAGGGLELSPFEGLSANELSLEATGKAGWGPVHVQAGYKAAHNLDTRCDSGKWLLRAEAGPFKADLLEPEKSLAKVKPEDLLSKDENGKYNKTVKDMFKKTGFKAEAAAKGKLCRNFRW